MNSSPPSVDQVLEDQVYLGNLRAAESEQTKERYGITHTLSVCPELLSSGPRHLVIPVDDSEYDDLLIHLPEACRFIEDALAQKGRVLIHCVMGISRSTTVLAAYLMKTRSMSVSDAICFIKQYRPQVQPNYGFLKQLEAFSQCGYAPSVDHPAYIAWKKRQRQDVTNFLNHLFDVTVVPDALYLCSEFPTDHQQAELLLYYLGITHIVSLAPAKVKPIPGVTHRHIHIPPDAPDALLFALPSLCDFIRDAVSSGGQVLVYSVFEARACILTGAYLMASRNISPRAATAVLQEALPLFDPTSNFKRALALFAACKHKPTPDHPAITSQGTTASPKSALTAENMSATLCGAELLTRTATAVMSETGLDMAAFGDALSAIQMKASMQQHSASTVA
ncbi:phosphatases II [Favolaschia claudopus]|uniref:protein-tyrosine-phosphatase n=1 Tax=Favolaschia claudopus TaxID=2862362 RepID=A0AAW0CAK8_9AGAR